MWKTKDGKEIPYDEMTDSHLMSAMRCVLRFNWEHENDTSPYFQEQMSNNEKIYTEMEKELENRKSTLRQVIKNEEQRKNGHHGADNEPES